MNDATNISKRTGVNGSSIMEKPPSNASNVGQSKNAVTRDPYKPSIGKSGSLSVVNQEMANRKNSQLLLLIRLIFFTYYVFLGTLVPYLPVYYQSLGHGGQAIGLLGAVKPLSSFIAAPMWGVLSDSSSSPNFILQFTFVTSLILQLLLPLRDDVTYLVGMGLLTAILNAPIKGLIDNMVLSKLSEENRGQYGKFRLWGQLGYGLGSSCVGFYLSRVPSDATSASSTICEVSTVEQLMYNTNDMLGQVIEAPSAIQQYAKIAAETIIALICNVKELLRNIRGYQIAFLAHGLLSIPAFLCMQLFQRYDVGADTSIMKGSPNGAKQKSSDLKKKDGSQIIQGLRLLFHNGDAMLFFFLVFVAGTSNGVFENFAYVRIGEVGGTGKEMGLSRIVSSTAGAPMFWFSGSLTKKLGADRVLVFNLLSYVARFFIYAFMTNAYQIIPADVLKGVSFAVFWSTSTVFAHRISPPGMNATMLMLLNAMYSGLGQSLGSIIGGKLQSKFGTANAFMFSGIFNFCFVCVVVAYLSVRKESSFRNPTYLLHPTHKVK